MSYSFYTEGELLYEREMLLTQIAADNGNINAWNKLRSIQHELEWRDKDLNKAMRELEERYRSPNGLTVHVISNNNFSPRPGLIHYSQHIVWHDLDGMRHVASAQNFTSRAEARSAAFMLAKELGWTEPKWWQVWRWKDSPRCEHA